MTPFNKKAGGFKKPFNKGGFDKGEKEMFAATCSNCSKACEVPFRPTGERPVYCRECFAQNMASRDSNGTGAPRRDFGGRDHDNARGGFEQRRPTPSFAPQAPRPQSDVRIDELKRQIDAVHNKLDVVVKMIEGLTPVASTPVAKPRKKKK